MLDGMGYVVLKIIADINCGTELFPEVMKSFSLRFLFKKFSSTLQAGYEVSNDDYRLHSPILIKYFDHKYSKENVTDHRRYNSLPSILFQ